MSSERTDTTDRPSHTCSSAEDLVPDWEGCGRAGRCPDPIWLPAVHPSVRSGSRVLSVSKKTKKKKRRAAAAARDSARRPRRLAASLAAAGYSACRCSPARRHRCLACRRRGLRAPRPRHLASPRPALHLAPSPLRASAPRTAPRAAAAAPSAAASWCSCSAVAGPQLQTLPRGLTLLSPSLGSPLQYCESSFCW